MAPTITVNKIEPVEAALAMIANITPIRTKTIE